MNRNVKIMIVGQVFVGLVTMRVCAQTDQPATPLERVLAKYPSRETLQARVDQFKATHADAFLATAADFDLAIRSMVGLDFPAATDGTSLHASPKPQELRRIYTRDKWMDTIARCRAKGTPNALERANFYEQHLDDMSFERNEAFRMVALEVIASDWQDWSNWTAPKLEDVRSRIPDIHCIYALREIWPHKSVEDRDLARDVTGVLLQALLEPGRRYEFRSEADRVITYSLALNPDEDILLLCLSELLRSQNPIEDTHLLGIASAVDDRLPRDRRRVLWIDYLDAPVAIVREMAVEGIGSSIRKHRPGEDPRPEDEELANRLRQISQSDQNKGVRRMAKTLVREYDTSDTRPTHGRGGGPKPP